MKTFLQQIEEAFEAIDKTDDIIDDIANREKFADGGDDLEEQNVTSAVAGYDIPAAFSKRGADDDTVEVLGYHRVKESVRTPATYKPGEHQRPESAEEEYNSKFPFAEDSKYWQHEKYDYPSVPYAKSYKKYSNRPADVEERFEVEYDWSGIRNKTDKHVNEIIDLKYEQLIESYRKFKQGDDKPSNKVKRTIQEIATKLREIETLVGYNSKLKEEAGVTSSVYGPKTKKALNTISERLIKISERIRSLGE
jgi:hypothetical protein